MMGRAIPFHANFVSESQSGNIAKALSHGHFRARGPFSQICVEGIGRLVGTGKVVLTQSCTAAMEVMALALGLGPGDEVIVPTFTFCATATAIERTGARAVLADIDPSDMMTTVEHCRRMINARTKAIMAVHYGGSCIDLRALRALCDDHGIHLLEDAAQALGAARDGLPAGSVGTMAAFSFHETKIAHCGHGGALVVNSTCPKLLRRIDEIINRGTDFSTFASAGSSHYQWVGHGGSFELSELQAALLASQLQALPRIISSRQAIAARYSAGLADLAGSGLMAFLKHRGTNNGHVFAVLMKSAKAAADLINHCNAAGIQAQSHYMPLHLSRAGRRHRAVATCPNATQTWNRLVRLPIHTEMTFHDVDRVVDTVREHVAPARRNAA